MPETISRGRFVWHELMTPDPEAALKFYTQVVGWKTEAWDKNTSYIMWMTERGPIGGLMTLPAEAKMQGAPPHWLAYISTPDLDATVAELRRAGVRFRNDVVTGVGGKQIIAEDPSGNPVELFEPTLPEAKLG